MSVTVGEVETALRLFFRQIQKPIFYKSKKLNDKGESFLLPYLRMFFLGYFGRKTIPEKSITVSSNKSGKGRIDFVIGGTAVEVAIRKPKDGKLSLSDSVNSSEVKKLLKHEGLAVLALLDFSKNPLEKEDLEKFRDWPSLGKGNHNISPFNILYFYRSENGTKVIKRRIRI